VLDFIENYRTIGKSPSKASRVNGSKVAFERVVEATVVGQLSGLMPKKGRLTRLPGSR